MSSPDTIWDYTKNYSCEYLKFLMNILTLRLIFFVVLFCLNLQTQAWLTRSAPVPVSPAPPVLRWSLLHLLTPTERSIGGRRAPVTSKSTASPVLLKVTPSPLPVTSHFPHLGSHSHFLNQSWRTHKRVHHMLMIYIWKKCIQYIVEEFRTRVRKRSHVITWDSRPPQGGEDLLHLVILSAPHPSSHQVWFSGSLCHNSETGHLPETLNISHLLDLRSVRNQFNGCEIWFTAWIIFTQSVRRLSFVFVSTCEHTEFVTDTCIWKLQPKPV